MQNEIQAFLDRTPQSQMELIAQRIITSHTKTHLLQLERSFRNLDKALYTTSLKSVTLTELYAAITFAKMIVCDGQQPESSSM